MKTPVLQKILHTIRKRTPLSIRHAIGPKISYIIYLINIYVRRNRKRPNVLSIPDSIDKIITEELSVIRFGDGEITMIDGGDTAFQKYDPKIAEGLENVMRKSAPDLLICIPGIWNKLNMLRSYAYWFNIHHIYRHGHVYKDIVSYDQIYGDTNITRPYLAYKDRTGAGQIFNKLFSIWKNKEVVIIEGTGSRLGLGNNMFDEAKSVERLLCPPENAFGKYSEILDEAKKIDKNKLVLVSLGPTAKILSYELYSLGYRVLDVGHIDMEYEMFLRKEEKLTKVKNKYFNEINERNPEDVVDPKYLSQIIKTIT